MAWMELHQSLPQNKKTLRFKRLLGIRTPQAVGHLCMLWLWAIDNAPDGDLTPFDPSELAEVCGYDGEEPGRFLSALREAGFLDADGCIHDWHMYTGRLLEQRELQREQARLRQQKRRGKLRGLTRDGSVTHASTAPNPTGPNPTGPNQTEPGAGTLQPDGPRLSERVEAQFSADIRAPRFGERETLCRLVETYSEPAVLSAIARAKGRGKSANYLAAMLAAEPPRPCGTGNVHAAYDLDEFERLPQELLLTLPPTQQSSAEL